MSILNNKQTEASKTMGDTSHVANAPVVPGLSNAYVEERLPSGFDQFSLSDHDKKSYGIKADEEHCWIRNPKIWLTDEKSDRARSFLNTHRGEARLVKDESGDFVCEGDLILACRKREYVKAVQARIRQQDAEWDDKIENEALDGHFDPGDKAALKERKRRTSDQARQAGIVGTNSPTTHMGLSDAERRYTPQQIEAEESRYRRGGRHVTMREVAAETVDRMKSASTAKKSFLMSNNPLAKNKAAAAAK